ncbi:alpha/beta hydrolase fold domain-containing protein [Plasticicumulans acidivorans]|uniref:Acetyl esterase/lipase n=1 Tax=Plasticicumulans acidivorans TaxID=886464 RepID=A0A317MTA7_9GAMM|nr:alpha/beta hydrolase [Plasticicumulans acidivorans]PWV60162.1 acetyl esterase/lipase [Plasticicumulans acidivorans]
MPSLRARTVLFALKHSHWLHLEWRRKPLTFDTDLSRLRAEMDSALRMLGGVPSEVEVEITAASRMRAEWLRPLQALPGRALLYIHGGGYIGGSMAGYRATAARFARDCQAVALNFDYRLAPEHPFPAALDDVLAAYAHLRDAGFAPQNIVFVGDSAGGGLCLAALLALREYGRPLPAAAVAISPWVDLRPSSRAFHESDPALADGLATVCSHYYAGSTPRDEPLLSPLCAELHGLPPLLLYAGRDEVLRHEIEQLTGKVQAAGGDVRLVIGEGMVHDYPLLAPLFPEAQDAFADICAFVRKHGAAHVSDSGRGLPSADASSAA